MPELNAVSAALKGNPEMEETQHELTDSYAELMATALLPYSGLAPRALRLRCVGVLGAAEAVAAELNRGRVSDGEAVSALTDLIVGGLGAGSERDEGPAFPPGGGGVGSGGTAGAAGRDSVPPLAPAATSLAVPPPGAA